jgi:hypothetical protein
MLDTTTVRENADTNIAEVITAAGGVIASVYSNVLTSYFEAGTKQLEIVLAGITDPNDRIKLLETMQRIREQNMSFLVGGVTSAFAPFAATIANVAKIAELQTADWFAEAEVDIAVNTTINALIRSKRLHDARLLYAIPVAKEAADATAEK